MRNLGALVCATLACAGCEREARQPPRPAFRAVGTLILDGIAPDDAAWATELELIRSQRLLAAVSRRLAERGPAPELEPLRRGLTATRRGESRVIEVSLAHDEGPLAETACNLVLEAYIELRIAADRDATLEAAAAHADELDQLERSSPPGSPARLQHEKAVHLAEQQLADRAPRRDVRVLDRCQLFRRTPR